MKHSPYNRDFWRNFESYKQSTSVNTPKLIGHSVAFVTFIVLLLSL